MNPAPCRKTAAYSTASGRRRAFDDTPAEATIAVVQDGELAGRHGTLRLIEAHFERAAGAQGGVALLVRLPVAHLDLRAELDATGLHQPVAGPRGQCTTDEQRMVVPLHRDQLVASEV